MTPLHSSIKNVLLPICLEATAKSRREIPENLQIPEGFLDECKRTIALDTKFGMQFCKLVTVAIGLPTNILNQTVENVVEVFCVVRIVEDSSNHRMPIGSKVLVTHPRNHQFLGLDGKADWRFVGTDYKPATDEEVEEFIDKLTPKQQRTIMSADIFAPIIRNMYEEPSEETIAVKVDYEENGKQYRKLSNEEPIKLGDEYRLIGSSEWETVTNKAWNGLNKPNTGPAYKEYRREIKDTEEVEGD